MQLTLNDVSFWYLDKTASAITPDEFAGLLGLTLPTKSIDVDIKICLIPSTIHADYKDSRSSLRHFHVIENATVSISDDVNIEVRDSNHPVLTTLFKPIMVSRLKDALERTLSEELKGVIEWIDGVAWDVAERREVFEDTGLSGHGSLMAALWSELGRLQRERRNEIGLRATGTGVVFEQDKGEGKGKSAFAFGAEPQILAGEKRGPLGTSFVALLAVILTLIAFTIDIALFGLVKMEFNGLGAGIKTKTGPGFWLSFVTATLVLLLIGTLH